MSGCNSNQNSYVLAAGGRSTSRVLAPPGGASSISFGTYNEPSPRNRISVSPVDGSQYRKKANGFEPVPHQQDYRRSHDIVSSSRPRQERGSHRVCNNMPVNPAQSRPHINDSLDSLMIQPRSFPGHESRMEKDSQRHVPVSTGIEIEPVVSTRRCGMQQRWGQDEYAEMLKNQIATKKSLDSSEDNEGRQRLRRSVFKCDDGTRQNQFDSTTIKHRGIANRAPPGGHSTFSMKWE